MKTSASLRTSLVIGLGFMTLVFSVYPHPEMTAALNPNVSSASAGRQAVLIVSEIIIQFYLNQFFCINYY